MITPFAVQNDFFITAVIVQQKRQMSQTQTRAQAYMYLRAPVSSDVNCHNIVALHEGEKSHIYGINVALWNVVWIDDFVYGSASDCIYRYILVPGVGAVWVQEIVIGKDVLSEGPGILHIGIVNRKTMIAAYCHHIFAIAIGNDGALEMKTTFEVKSQVIALRTFNDGFYIKTWRGYANCEYHKYIVNDQWDVSHCHEMPIKTMYDVTRDGRAIEYVTPKVFAISNHDGIKTQIRCKWDTSARMWVGEGAILWCEYEDSADILHVQREQILDSHVQLPSLVDLCLSRCRAKGDINLDMLTEDLKDRLNADIAFPLAPPLRRSKRIAERNAKTVKL